jgi:triacylglycerol esterase/lipase EstA (alpha/beta hydrolase family)
MKNRERRSMKIRILFTCFVLLYPCLAHSGNRNATRYPVVLAHHWSGTAKESFLGDDIVGDDFRAWGVKQSLEEEGAVVYQPGTTPFASSEVRGRLLYRKCAGTTFTDMLCQGDNPQTVDGIEPAMVDYCSDTNKRGREYASYDDCIQKVKVNIICHSQSCADSRYMISQVTNRLSGKPMSRHVASWTSLAGANKGTRLADLALGLVDDCDEPECQGPDFVEALLSENGVKKNGEWVPGGYDSLVSLSRKYMTRTMDISCNPLFESCPPSFNQAYPNPPGIYYQSYSGVVRWLHPCYTEIQQTWPLLLILEGENDGWISVDSQKFQTAGNGWNPKDPPTRVVYRGNVTGESTVWYMNHPGITHMGLNNAKVPGLPQIDCSEYWDDDEVFYFSREGFYQDLVEDLKNKGF